MVNFLSLGIIRIAELSRVPGLVQKGLRQVVPIACSDPFF